MFTAEKEELEQLGRKSRHVKFVSNLSFGRNRDTLS